MYKVKTDRRYNMWNSFKHFFWPEKTSPSVTLNFFDHTQKTLLVIDDYLPFHDQSSGSKRLFELVKIAKNLGLNVIFMPDNNQAPSPYDKDLKDLEVDILLAGTTKKNQFKTLYSLLAKIDFAWISRPALNLKYQDQILKTGNTKVIFDTVDLHYLRMFRQAEKENNPKLLAKAKKTKQLELALASAADATVVVTETEQQLLVEESIDAVHVIPNVHEAQEDRQKVPFDQRNGIIFIGGYKHQPNVDAVIWLIQEIMPIVWSKIGKVKVSLLGSDPPPMVLAMANENVIVPGYLHDVSDYFLKARIFVAPLRYGAGMKGKIGQSLEYGLPIVSTSIGTEGMKLLNGVHVLTADDHIAFADNMVRLYTEQEIWNNIQTHAAKALESYTPNEVSTKLQRLFDELTTDH